MRENVEPTIKPVEVFFTPLLPVAQPARFEQKRVTALWDGSNLGMRPPIPYANGVDIRVNLN